MAGGTLGGNGTIGGAVTVQGGGTLAAGTPSAIGTLTLGSTLDLNADSINLMRINKTGSTLTADKVSMSGSGGIAYNGTLVVVSNANSDAFTGGDEFTLFAKSAGAFSGSFAAISLPPLGAGLTWDTSQLPTTAAFRCSRPPSWPRPTSIRGGGYAGAQSVVISSATVGATIYYTTDNWTTTNTYTVPVMVPVSATTTIQAYAVKSGLLNSAVGSATYVTEPVAVWLNPSGGSWADPNNWTNNIVGQGRNGTADLSTLALAGPAAVTLDMSPTIGNLIFGDVGDLYTWEVGPGNPAGVLTLDATNTPVVNVINQTTTIAAAVAGTNGLTKAGAGTLTLGGVNTYSGETTVAAGTLKLNVVNASGSGAITLNDAAPVPAMWAWI